MNFFLDTSNEGDQLVIANSYVRFKKNKTNLKTYLKEIEDLHIYLQKNKRKLIIVSPIPVIQSDPTVCSNWYVKYNNKCDIKKIFNPKENNDLKKVNQHLLTLRDKKIKVIDIYSLLEKKLNSYDIENYDFYFNKSHLSKKGAKLFTNEFEKIFSE